VRHPGRTWRAQHACNALITNERVAANRAAIAALPGHGTVASDHFSDSTAYHQQQRPYFNRGDSVGVALPGFAAMLLLPRVR